VVAGTHGKTTTTAMIAHILRQAGRDPGWLIGGIPHDLPVPCWKGSGEEFVIEGDEYDSVYYDKRPKFLHYQPRIAVLTSVEFDHADIYQDIKAVEDAFTKFVRLIPKSGKLITYGDDARVKAIAAQSLSNVQTYGFSADCDWQITDIRTSNEDQGISGEFSSPAGISGVIRLRLLGNHNLLNALAAVAVAHEAGIEINVALSTLHDFRGVKRRLELLAETDQVCLWEDFAHHPTAIKTTLEGLRQHHPGRRLWVLVEPRSNTMVRNFFQNELFEALSLADKVTIAPLHRLEKIKPAERLDVKLLSANLNQRGIETMIAKDFQEIEKQVVVEMKQGDVIVIMSNGGFGGIKERIVELVGKLECY
jgi:UDP-N-acetylmuramate: L-alanyl-gamma-D-glutamyl-meso-diaminopimelate ligase